MKCSLCVSDKFLGNEERPYQICRGCGAMERHRILWDLLLQSGISPDFVIEISPLNKRVFGEFLQKKFYCKYWSMDKWKSGNPKDPRDVHFVDSFCDIVEMSGHIPFQADLIIMQHVIEEVPDYKRGLKEISLSLKKGGIAFLEIPVKSRDGHINHGPNHFGNVWEFSQKEMISDLEEVFNVVRLHEYKKQGVRGIIFQCER